MPFAIRSATLADVPAILAIERQSASAAHWSQHEYEKLVKCGAVWIAEPAIAEQGTEPSTKLCGFVCVKVVTAEVEIENIVVATEFLRQGIADRLLHVLIRQARILATSTILLEVRESNLAARRLYEKHGFLESGRRPKYYNNPCEDAILYALRFESPKQR